MRAADAAGSFATPPIPLGSFVFLDEGNSSLRVWRALVLTAGKTPVAGWITGMLLYTSGRRKCHSPMWLG